MTATRRTAETALIHNATTVVVSRRSSVRRRSLITCLAAVGLAATLADGYTTLKPSAHTRLVRSPPHQHNKKAALVLFSGLEDGHKAPSEFDLHVGRALDTLRADYPKLLHTNPNFSIYDPTIACVDPSGVQTHGLGQYKAAFNLLHALVKVVYCTDRSIIQSKLCYDTARHNIRISWNVQLYARDIFGGKAGHVDGISVYELDGTSGNITQHRIERLLYNNRPVKEGVMAALKKQENGAVPSFFKETTDQDLTGRQVVPFVPQFTPKPYQSIFAATESSDGSDMYPDLDWDALASKNKSRQKFGLKPLTPEEFLSIEADVQTLAATTQQNAKAQKSDAADQSGGPSILDKMFGSIRVDTCTSNYDCARPEVCCDFGFIKKCCSSGSPVGSRKGDLAYVRVPQDTGYPNPPQPRTF